MLFLSKSTISKMDLNWVWGLLKKDTRKLHIFTDYVVHVYFCEFIDYILP